ncbi:F0F1 ATP synthase subunit A [Vulgatibacter incomptus]|uniref:ATP synthase subunit a n=1 Tax=Vulgatibacter incomptus TaxID=1391653 RepID=A0A0K1PHD5_9BACT|nr:F0F1 ATP synthase subunit A [Vulgatibacter incomptus]AKU92922.1 ATP synthase F0 sector subunit a [Vulgatibacter incomptus]
MIAGVRSKTRIAAAALLSASFLAFAPSAQASEDGHEANVPEVVFAHVADGNDITFENPITGAAATFVLPEWKVQIGGTELDLSPTRHTVFLWLAAVLVVGGVSIAARRRSLVPRGFYSVVEVFVKFIREELAQKNIGKAHADHYVPFLATIFFLIFTANLLGLIPYFATATANVNVTVGFAICTFVVTMYAGMKEQGIAGFWLGIVPKGVPLWLYPIMVPVEILGLFTKPFALTVRLFANMVAGHIVLFFLLALIFLLQGAGAFVAPVSVAFATGIFFLELFVALLQAYIFTMLSALFIGMASHPH